MSKQCLSCSAPIPDTLANRSRKRCEPCAAEHHKRSTIAKRSEARKARTWGMPFTCPICKVEFTQDQRPGVPSRYCPSCTAIRAFGSAR